MRDSAPRALNEAASDSAQKRSRYEMMNGRDWVLTSCVDAAARGRQALRGSREEAISAF